MKSYRIGLMVGNKSIDYIHAIRMGVQNLLEEAGHTLIAISDLIPFHSRANAQAYFRVAFEIAARLNLDAIIVPAGTISSYLMNDRESLLEFLSILDPKKTVVLEREVEGYRCITKDNDPGMHECMRHLIENCGFKKIAFIGGPEGSVGGKMREAVYRDEMHRHGLETPDRLFARGEYSGECFGAIEKLIDENPDLEAIACCVDLIAFSVYDVMHKRGLTVGRDIAVTGFDDAAMAAHMNPPLSTVHMTGYDLGQMAAREAIRMCEGKSQEEDTLSSSFIPRGSCGEDGRDLVEKYHSLIMQKPFPFDEVVDIVTNATLVLAGRSVTQDFRQAVNELLRQILKAYERHTQNPESSDPLFEAQDLNLLFEHDFGGHVSLEGFQTTAISLLKALDKASNSTDSHWVIEQISNLHHGISRLLNTEIEHVKQSMSMREWIAFHITDDAIRESTHPHAAYRNMMNELRSLGMHQADVFLLPEPVQFMGTRTFALSDTLIPVGHLYNDKVAVILAESPTSLQKLLDTILPGHGSTSAFTIGGIMAGDELMGIVAIDAGTLDDNGQLIAFLNLGIALKHLQLIAEERESNELLSKNNILLERQSHYDELTGILNRRGFMSKLHQVFNNNLGKKGAILYLDLDGLKFINDTYGHDSGDEAIRQTTYVLSACMPPNTVLGRFGGDEFVAFVLEDSKSKIDSIGHAIDAGMCTFNATHSYPFDLAISYGSVFLDIDDHAFAEISNALALADDRLYAMKVRRGRGRRR